jgi:hypothetical protein
VLTLLSQALGLGRPIPGNDADAEEVVQEALLRLKSMRRVGDRRRPPGFTGSCQLVSQSQAAHPVEYARQLALSKVGRPQRRVWIVARSTSAASGSLIMSVVRFAAAPGVHRAPREGQINRGALCVTRNDTFSDASARLANDMPGNWTTAPKAAGLRKRRSLKRVRNGILGMNRSD